jgi:hypothetical protein
VRATIATSLCSLSIVCPQRSAWPPAQSSAPPSWPSPQLMHRARAARGAVKTPRKASHRTRNVIRIHRPSRPRPAAETEAHPLRVAAPKPAAYRHQQPGAPTFGGGGRAAPRRDGCRSPARSGHAGGTAYYSVQKKYPRKRAFLWAGEDSNLRLTDYESAALTAELPARPSKARGARGLPAGAQATFAIARWSSPAEKAPSKRAEIRPLRSMTNVQGSDCRRHAATCGRTPLSIWLSL